MRPIQSSPSGAGPCSASANSANCSGESSGCALGVRGAPILHARWPLLVVAAGDLTNPVARIAGALGDGCRGLPFSQEPENLKPTSLVRFLGSSIAPLKLVHRQMRFEVNASGHPPLYNHLLRVGMSSAVNQLRRFH